MALTIMTIILGIAVLVLAVLVCAMRGRLARDERELYKTLTVDNHRLWTIYDTLRIHLRQDEGRKGKVVSDNLIDGLARAFNGEEKE